MLPGHIVSGGGSELNGQSGAKQFFIWGYGPIQPDVVPHDSRLLSNISQFWKGRKGKGEES